MAVTFPDRVATKAGQVNVLRLLLSVLALIPWLLGVLVGVLFLAVAWMWAAAVIGFGDARTFRARSVKPDDAR